MDLNETLADMDTHTIEGTQADVCPDAPTDANKLLHVHTSTNKPVGTDTHTHSNKGAHTHSSKETGDSDGTSLESPPAQVTYAHTHIYISTHTQFVNL